MFDDSIRVPLVIRWPEAIPAGLVRDEMVTSLDFFPTFREILQERGTPEPPSLEGRSLLPLLRGESPAWRDEVCMLYDMYHGALGRMRMARTREWKLVEHAEEGGAHELYHLAADPGEERNLYGDPNADAARDELTARLRAWQRRVGDPLASA
jgi:arylsulfatase A-like enzyme